MKGFRPEIYRACGGDLETTKHFIARTAAHCHVEVTTLIVPGLNDDPDDMAKEAAWLADVNPDLTPTLNPLLSDVPRGQTADANPDAQRPQSCR